MGSSNSSSVPTRDPGFTRARLAIGDISGVVSDCAAELKQMDGGAVLLTGATGWFGTWLLDVLLAAQQLLPIKFEVIALSRDPDAFLAQNPGFEGAQALRWVHGDVCSFSSTGFTYVLHAATDSGANAARVGPRAMFETILRGTERALAAAGSGCRGFLYFSSGAVYGSQPTLPYYSEDMLLGPDCSSARSAYAEAKRAGETLCAIAAEEGVPARIARCFAFVGPHMPFDRHFAIGNFIADAVEGRNVRVRGDGSAVRSYLYVADLMRACLRILVRGEIARPYNVGSDQAISVQQLAETVNTLLGGRGVLIEGAAGHRIDRYVPDIARLRGELGFKRQVSLQEAILKTADWYRTQEKYAAGIRHIQN